jgi:hypothetical protein
MNARAVRASANAELPIIVLNAGRHACNTPAGVERRSPADTSIIGDDQVNPIAGKSRIDNGLRGCCMPMNVGERFLNDAQEAALHFIR